MNSRKISLILHNVRSVHNVGSIFRTADAAGVQKIFLTGYTPAPVNRFGGEVSAFTKTSLGAEKAVSWEGRNDPKGVIQHLKKEGVKIVALEQHPEALDYRTAKLSSPVALCVGNEVRGLSSQFLSLADEIIEIPMKGEKESLNVSVATGIALFSLSG